MAEGVSERIQLIVSGCLDTSELRNVLIGGVETVVHFCVCAGVLAADVCGPVV